MRRPLAFVSCAILAILVASAEAESDLAEVDVSTLKYDGSALNDPYKTAPWSVNDQTTVWTSENAKAKVAAFLDEAIPFAANIKGKDLLDSFAQDGKCPVYIVRGTAIFAALNKDVSWKASMPVHIRVACDLATIQAVCDDKKIHYTAADGTLFVGNGSDRSEKDAATKRFFVVRPASSDMYCATKDDIATATMIYYDPARNILIDKHGKGLSLAEKNEIDIPSLGKTVDESVNAWFTMEKAAEVWGVEGELDGALSLSHDTGVELAKRVKNAIAADAGVKKSFTKLVYHRMNMASGDDEAASNVARSEVLVALRSALRRDFGPNYYSAFLSGAEPACPGFFDVVKDGEPFVRNYVKILRDVRSAINARFSGTTHYIAFARLRTAAALHEACERLKDKDGKPPKDLAGIRVLAATKSGADKIVKGIQDEVFKDKTTVFNNFLDEPREDGYRSWDSYVAVESETVVLQVRTVLMTGWAEWYHEVNKVNPELIFNSHPEVLKYKNDISGYLVGIDTTRSSISYEDCPDLLKNAVIEHPDVLSSSLTDGCFRWPDMALNGNAKSMVNYFDKPLDYDDGTTPAEAVTALDTTYSSLRSGTVTAAEDGEAKLPRSKTPLYHELHDDHHMHWHMMNDGSIPEHIDRFEVKSPFIADPEALGETQETNPYDYTMDDAVKYIQKHVSLYHLALRTVKEIVGSNGKVTARLKSPKSLYANFFIKNKKMEEYHDIVGLRVTSETVGDLLKVKEALLQVFTDAKVKHDPWKFSEGYYRSLHILPKASAVYGKEWGKKINRGLEFEIQLRTPSMSFFADWSHDLVYKGDISVRDDEAVKAYVKKAANALLDIDKVRDNAPECPKALADTQVINDLTSNTNNYNACFHWHDADAVTLDEYVPPAKQPTGWPASAIAICTALGTLSVVLAGILCFWTVMSVFVVRQKRVNVDYAQMGDSYRPIHELDSIHSDQ